VDTIGPFVFGTDGSEYDRLIVKEGGARFVCPVIEHPHGTLEMQGSSIFLFTMSVVPASINKLLKNAEMTLNNVDLVVFHQASKLVIDNLTQRLSLDTKKVFTNYASIGNTVSATIPIALKDADTQGRLHNGDNVLLVGFGVGLSWGVTLMCWASE